MRYGMQYGMNGNLRPDGGMMRMFRDGSRTGFLGALALSVSIKDRSLSAVPIGD